MKTNKFKNIVSLLLVGMVQTAIPEDQIFYQGAADLKYDPAVSSVPLQESESFANCQCDVTAGACDNFCCCDLDCSASLRNVW